MMSPNLKRYPSDGPRLTRKNFTRNKGTTEWFLHMLIMCEICNVLLAMSHPLHLTTIIFHSCWGWSLGQSGKGQKQRFKRFVSFVDFLFCVRVFVVTAMVRFDTYLKLLFLCFQFFGFCY